MNREKEKIAKRKKEERINANQQMLMTEQFRVTKLEYEQWRDGHNIVQLTPQVDKLFFFALFSISRSHFVFWGFQFLEMFGFHLVNYKPKAV